jgi:hypothetical protein
MVAALVALGLWTAKIALKSTGIEEISPVFGARGPITPSICRFASWFTKT